MKGERICNTPGCKRSVHVSRDYPDVKFGKCEECLRQMKWRRDDASR